MKVKPITADDLTGETERRELIQQGRREIADWVDAHLYQKTFKESNRVWNEDWLAFKESRGIE